MTLNEIAALAIEESMDESPSIIEDVTDAAPLEFRVKFSVPRAYFDGEPAEDADVTYSQQAQKYSPEGMTDLQKHDAKYHPDGYKEGDSCKFRDNMSKGDSADIIDPENVDGEDAPATGGQLAPASFKALADEMESALGSAGATGLSLEVASVGKKNIDMFANVSWKPGKGAAATAKKAIFKFLKDKGFKFDPETSFEVVSPKKGQGMVDFSEALDPNAKAKWAQGEKPKTEKPKPEKNASGFTDEELKAADLAMQKAVFGSEQKGLYGDMEKALNGKLEFSDASMEAFEKFVGPDSPILKALKESQKKIKESKKNKEHKSYTPKDAEPASTPLPSHLENLLKNPKSKSLGDTYGKISDWLSGKKPKKDEDSKPQKENNGPQTTWSEEQNVKVQKIADETLNTYNKLFDAADEVNDDIIASDDFVHLANVKTSIQKAVYNMSFNPGKHDYDAEIDELENNYFSEFKATAAKIQKQIDEAKNSKPSSSSGNGSSPSAPSTPPTAPKPQKPKNPKAAGLYATLNALKQKADNAKTDSLKNVFEKLAAKVQKQIDDLG